ncbi:hypothetical protein L7F22_061821 [Adiantum nelumboides]|nr:hypothetical protein [Adiantum nelumboides]
MSKLKIKHRHSTPYYPQCNGLVEKVNGLICKIITKQVRLHPKEWDKHLDVALWAYRSSFKTSLGYTPFHLVYGQEALLPIEVELASLRVLKAHQEDNQEKQVKKRIIDLEKLGLDQESTVEYYATQAEKKRKKFNRNLVKKGIKESFLVLKYDNRLDRRKNGKFLLKWEGPFVVIQRFSNGSYQLGDLDGKVHHTLVNDWRLKAYHCRLSQPYAGEINAEDGSEESSSYLSSNYGNNHVHSLFQF